MSKDGQDTTPPIPSSSEVSLGVRIDRICGEFEELLKAGKAPKIETYLSELPPDHQSLLLEELLGLELDYRAKAGDSFTSEEYTLRFPEHARAVAELVVSVRQHKPGNPGAEEAKPRQSRLSPMSPGSSHTTQHNHGRTPGEPVRIGPYEIIEPCGRGGMGVVYKAWHEFFKQYRAIKVLPSNFDEDDISRFSMEIELAGRLNHPNIVRAHEANREQGILYLVMEFVDGINLDHLVKHHKRLPMGLACEMIRQAAEGLQHAHEHFLVHRDIKPSNLMINQQGQVKILDFGLARLHAEQNASRLTKHGSVMGTMDFMAPEQWEDPMGATIQADIYSLGCTLYYLVTGTPPYGGEDYFHWIKKQEAHRQHAVPRVEHEQGEALQPIINRMMAKSRAERFKTPAEVVEALEPLSDPSELKRFALTPVPKTSTSGISRTPIPTVNVSSSDLLGNGMLEQLAGRFSPDDSEANSNQKTLRPHQSRTDVDSDHPPSPGPKPPLPPWYTSRRWQGVLTVLTVVLLAAMWLVFRPAQNKALAVQMGALPGLNGGLNGDWWFAEMHWYGPGPRKVFMEALRRGETHIAGIALANWEQRLASADTESLRRNLETIVQELKLRLPDREHKIASRMLELNPNMEQYDQVLLDILPAEFLTNAELNEEILAEHSATELHAFANILHWVSTSNTQLAANLPANTEAMYERTIKAYDEADPVESVLLALVQYDYARFLADRRNYSLSIYYAKEAASTVPEAPLFHISLRCQLADKYRRWNGNTALALSQISGDENSAEAWAEKMSLDPNHPLRAEMLERQAWINVDAWNMKQAIQDFKNATRIRTANQKLDNTFAWRPILLNEQGRAMALHFLGRNNDKSAGIEDGTASLSAIEVYENLLETILNPPGDRPFGTEAERKDRLPNLYERWGDTYLYGDSKNYRQAERKFQSAIYSAYDQKFDISATMWFHLTRLYYKHCLALALQGDEEAKTVRDLAGDLETSFAQQMTLHIFEKQQLEFALEKEIALAVMDLKLSQASPTADPLNALQELITKMGRSHVNRRNIEVLLPVFELLFDPEIELSPKALPPLSLALLRVTEDMRKGDPAIRQVYLRPVFEQAYSAVDPLDPSHQYIKGRLAEVLEEEE